MVDTQNTNLSAVTSDQILNKTAKGSGKINESRHFKTVELGEGTNETKGNSKPPAN